MEWSQFLSSHDDLNIIKALQKVWGFDLIFCAQRFKCASLVFGSDWLLVWSGWCHTGLIIKRNCQHKMHSQLTLLCIFCVWLFSISLWICSKSVVLWDYEWRDNQIKNTDQSSFKQLAYSASELLTILWLTLTTFYEECMVIHNRNSLLLTVQPWGIPFCQWGSLNITFYYFPLTKHMWHTLH